MSKEIHGKFGIEMEQADYSKGFIVREKHTILKPILIGIAFSIIGFELACIIYLWSIKP